jgi:isovaleryl-CoA dehydrogenase
MPTLCGLCEDGEGSRGITTSSSKGHAGLLDRSEDPEDGHARSPTAELVFNDCEVPDENVMGPVNGGVGVLMSGLDYERTVLAGIQLGIMQACLDVVLPVRSRAQAVRQADRRLPADAGQGRGHVCRAQFARAYVYTVARNCDAGKTTRFDAAGAILLASESAVKVSLEAIQALGGAGYTKDWPVERFMRDAKLLDIGAGTERDPPNADRPRADRGMMIPTK